MYSFSNIANAAKEQLHTIPEIRQGDKGGIEWIKRISKQLYYLMQKK